MRNPWEHDEIPDDDPDREVWDARIDDAEHELSSAEAMAAIMDEMLRRLEGGQWPR